MTRKLLYLGISAAAILLLIGGVMVWNREPHPGHYDETRQSTSLDRDIRLMWKTQPLGRDVHGKTTPPSQASTDAAINAASRVFNTVKLVGLTREEVIAVLGEPKTSNDSQYNFPFFPESEGTMVYRFDSGNYGWQFTLLFDAQGKVEKVERR